MAGTKLMARLDAKRLKQVLGFFMVLVAPTVPLKEHLLQRATARKLEEELAGGGRNRPATERSVGDLISLGSIGVVTGFLSGLFGVGGGAVTVPALSLATDMSHYCALGTSFAAMILPAIFGTISNYRNGYVVAHLAVPTAVGTMVGAFVGGRFVAVHIDESKLRWIFSGFMLVLGARTLGLSPASIRAIFIKSK